MQIIEVKDGYHLRRSNGEFLHLTRSYKGVESFACDAIDHLRTLRRKPLDRHEIAIVATYAPEGVSYEDVAEIVAKVELMHGVVETTNAASRQEED